MRPGLEQASPVANCLPAPAHAPAGRNLSTDNPSWLSGARARYTTRVVSTPNNPVRAMLMLTVGLALSAGVGVGFFLWAARFPTIVGVTQIVQGLVVAAILFELANRLRPGRSALVALIAALCGALSITVVWAGLYCQFVYQQADTYQQNLLLLSYKADVNDQLIDARQHPYRTVDQIVLVPVTGRAGPLGYAMLRQEQGIDILGRRHIDGQAVCWIWLGEALAVVLLPAILASRPLRAP